ncbi:MAG: aminotransferase class I/II-fold pyridoxal phosphate-dependent enzyme [Planctomycetaceae bacterium]|nr:aminotransferase class I/II-fold pyridoxal phosphate-dependent enzyme [Planctomycetaceae bacterium]
MTQTQKRIWLSAPHVMSPKEREYLLDAFDSNWIAPLGPHVDAFEREFAARVAGRSTDSVGAKHAVALSSGTAAIHLGLKLLGIGPGDEVIVSSLTFSASANPVTYVGATPVFIDSHRETWNIDPQLLADELAECARRNKLPRAVIAVDLYGQCADFDAILEICTKYEIPILEDAAEALGAKYKGNNAGTFGKIGIFSFNGNKIITSSGGGMLVTDNEDWAKKVRFWATQSRDPAPHYQHSEIGYNYRMSNLCAAVGRGQLLTLDERVAARRANFEYYKKCLSDLPGIDFMPEPEGFFSTRWLTVLTIDPAKFGTKLFGRSTGREDIRLALEAENIEARPVWKPMHLQPVFAQCRHRGGDVAESLFQNGLCLPSGSDLTPEQLDRIISITLRFT